MLKEILTVTLNPAVDKIVLLPRFVSGHDHRAHDIRVYAGGKGINVSRVLSTLKCATRAMGFLAGPNGEFISAQLAREKINCDFCFIDGNTRVNTTIIDSTRGVTSRVLEPGPVVTAKSLKTFLAQYRAALKRSSLVVLSGSLSPGIPDDFYRTLISLAKKKSIPSILDTSGSALKLGIAAKPFMIKPNLKEAQYLMGKRLSFSGLKKAAKNLHRRSSGIVAITAGSRGAVIFDGKDMFLGTPPQLSSKNAVGCGDAFIAGFIAGYLRKKPLNENLRCAVSCASANLLTTAPGLLKKTDILRMHRKTLVLRG